MVKERNIRIWGKQHKDIDVDLMTQIVIMLGRQLANEAMIDEMKDNNESELPKQNNMDLPGDELGQEAS